MNSNFVQRKYIVVVLASVVVGLAAFVGACALAKSSHWLGSEEYGEEMIGDASTLLPPHWSPDGTKIVLYWWAPYLVDASAHGAKLRTIVVGEQWENIYPRISPDGSQMVFSTQRHEVDEDNSEIGVSNLDGSKYRRMTRSRGDQYGPEWSPDGSHIAFMSYHRTRERPYRHSYSLFTMTDNGAGPRKLVDSVQATGPLAWSPDGRTIAFLGYERVQPGGWQSTGEFIYSVDRDGSNLTRLAVASSPPTWSPDGSAIAFLRGDDRNSVFVVNPDGSGLREIVDTNPNSTQESARDWFAYLSWSPDGSEILLQDYPFILVKADGTDYPEGESPYAVFADSQDWRRAYASWSPDGSRIAITVERMGEFGPIVGDAVLLTMARDGSDKRVLVRHGHEYRPYAVPNEPWEGEGEWVWHSP